MVVVVVAPLEALSAIKDTRKPDRGLFLSWLKTSKEITRKDCSCVLRIFAECRLSDGEVQLPMANKIIEWICRLLCTSFVLLLIIPLWNS